MEKGDHLALLLGNSPDFIIAFFGALKAGIVVVPINPLYTPTEIGYMLTNGDVKAIVGVSQLLPLYESMHESLPKVELVILCQTGEAEPEAADPEVRMKMTTFAKYCGRHLPLNKTKNLYLMIPRLFYIRQERLENRKARC